MAVQMMLCYGSVLDVVFIPSLFLLVSPILRAEADKVGAGECEMCQLTGTLQFFS